MQIFQLGGCSFLALLLCACQMNTTRVLEFSVQREDNAAGERHGFGPEQAVTLLQEVAEEIGQEVKGPRDVGGAWLEYNTEQQEPGRRGEATVKLFIDRETITFVVDKFGTIDDFQEARKVGELIVRRLDRFEIRYKTAYRSALFWGP